MQASDAEELARARLAYVSAGHRPIGAPRRALKEPPEPAPPPATRPPDTRDEPRRLTTRHLLVVAVLLLCGVGVAVAALGRSAATEVPVITSSAESEPGAASRPSASTSPEPVLRVHVAGAVASPGVVSLPAGSIVQDAIAAAGGLDPAADPAQLNLAQPLTDGLQILIGTKEQPQGEISGAAPSSGPGGGALDLNKATQTDLEDLPGVGPVMAQAILSWRGEHGGFTSTAELQEISGIGPKIFAKLEPLVSVG